MLKFLVFDKGKPAKRFPLVNAHLLGADNIGVQGKIETKSGLVVCDKRTGGPAALCVQYPAGELGHLMLQTCLLPDREKPYLLTLELARHRLMLLFSKQEEWMLYDLPDDHLAVRRAEFARQLFIKALTRMDEPAVADQLARRALVSAVDASEELALAHSGLLLNKRKRAGHLNRPIIGATVSMETINDTVKGSLSNSFDFVNVPTRWKNIEPREQKFNWAQIDEWVEWSFRNRLPIVAGPLVCFDKASLPEWVYAWEHDYETIRDLVYEHIERIVKRYRNVVSLWNVLSGIHVNRNFHFNFEQLMDLTRMAVMLTKKIQPSARTLVEITHPFGEYYAKNQRSIPPLIYADMVMQSGVSFDVFGLKLLMGQPEEGQFTRDLMVISALLDRFVNFGIPLHITAVCVPSVMINSQTEDKLEINSGYWRKPWSPLVQSHWMEAFYDIALSKPYVESVSWTGLVDDSDAAMPGGGLVTQDLKAKSVFQRMVAIRKTIHGN